MRIIYNLIKININTLLLKQCHEIITVLLYYYYQYHHHHHLCTLYNYITNKAL